MSNFENRWSWCGLCGYPRIQCPKCENISCSGGGCDECLVDFAEVNRMIREGKAPSRYELTGEGDMNEISIEEFDKIDLRVAVILTAEAIKGTDKLVQLTVNAGDGQGEVKTRTIVAGIRPSHTPEELVGQQVVIVANLAPRKMRGIESHGMLLAAKDGDNLCLIRPAMKMQDGAKIG